MQAKADFEYPTLEQALDAAETFTMIGYEVTKPLEVAGEWCIRIEADFPNITGLKLPPPTFSQYFS